MADLIERRKKILFIFKRLEMAGNLLN